MKYFILFLFFVAGIGLSFDTSAPAQMEDAAGYEMYRYEFTSDTITDTETDVLTVPVNLFSLWNYNYTLVGTNESGTTQLILILEETNDITGSDWYEVERDTLSGAGIVRLFGASTSGLVEGVRQRVKVTGVGTQSSLYIVNMTLKK